MSSIVADLHVHTTRSDGTTAPADIATVATDAGLEVVAITDHDRLPPKNIESDSSVTIVGGIELRVEAAIGRVDLLGYEVERTTRLTSLVSTIQSDRIERGRRMVDRLENALGIDLNLPIERGIGRPHIARAVAARTDLTAQEVFDRYIHSGGPCYVARSVPSFDQGRRILKEACSLVVLAHPLRYSFAAEAIEMAEQLDGLEYRYPYRDSIDRSLVDRAVSAGTFVLTGGSDAHRPEAIGSCGLETSEWQAVRSRLNATD